jgi:hypothetical protein
MVKAVATAGAAPVTVTDCIFFAPVNTSPAKAIFLADNGARAIFTGNRITDKGTGSGFFVSVVADGFHVIQDNSFVGWDTTLPASWTTMSFGNNQAIGSGNYNGSGFLIGNNLTRTYQGTCDGSGVATFAHGITSGNLKVTRALGFYKGASGEMKPMTLAYIEGTNASFTGGTASAPYRVTFEWAETSLTW